MDSADGALPNVAEIMSARAQAFRTARKGRGRTNSVTFERCPDGTDTGAKDNVGTEGTEGDGTHTAAS